MTNLLTIGIPSYKRAQALRGVLEQANEHFKPEHRRDTGILILDDDSPDGTFDQLQQMQLDPSFFTIRKNAVRAGFCGNFLNLIRECPSEYLLFSTDDDFLLADGVRALSDFLGSADVPPAMISTVFRNEDGSIYRGAEQLRPIHPYEFRNCCNHLPGVVFNARLAKAVLAKIEPLITAPNNYYPQACFSFLFLALNYHCVYHPAEPVATGYNLPSGISSYSSLGGRWSQFKFFDEFFKQLRARTDEADLVDKIDTALHEHRNSLFRTLGNGLLEENTELARYYLKGAAQYVGESQRPSVT